MEVDGEGNDSAAADDDVGGGDEDDGDDDDGDGGGGSCLCFSLDLWRLPSSQPHRCTHVPTVSNWQM